MRSYKLFLNYFESSKFIDTYERNKKEFLIFDVTVLAHPKFAYRKFKILAALLFFLVSNLRAQRFPNRCEQFQQGKVDVVISDSCLLDENTKNTVLDSVFADCNLALMQLEKNLIYKMSHRIKFILFNDAVSFSKYQSYHPFGNRNELDVQGNYLFYYPIFIGCNSRKIAYQIRKGTANQIIEEYLYGLNYRDKINGIQYSQIPIWMIKGFTEYFARGIEINDFQIFTQFEQLGYFKNINYIPTDAQTNFGTIVWYLFEKEKGRGFNSAFWYLIKYVNSFQGSFEYQFGQKFKVWLRSKISEIANKNKYSSIKTDFFIPIHSHKNTVLYQLNHSTLKNEQFHFLNLQESKFQRLFLIHDSKKVKLYHTKSISVENYLYLNHFEITNPSESLEKDGSQILLHFFEGHWMLSKITSNATLIHLSKFEKFGIYHKLKTIENGYSVIHEYCGKTDILLLSKKGEILKRIEVFSQNLIDYHLQNEFQYFLMSSMGSKLKSNYSYLTIHTINKIDTIYSDSNAISTIRIEDLIQESEHHLSFIKSGETQQQVVHLFNNMNGWKPKMVLSKGYFYRQMLSDDKQVIRYFFQTKNGIEQGEYPVDELIYDQDTFVQKSFSFDTAKMEPQNTQSNNRYDSSNGYFLSQYKEIIPQNKKLSTLNNLVPKKTIKYQFQQTFYATTSRIYFSNEEFDLPYLNKFPLTGTYNSIATLFLQEQIESDNKSQIFNIKGFVSLDRLRYGFKLVHDFAQNEYLHHSELMFRSRQYRTDFGDAIDNKSSQLSYKISNNFGNINFGIGLKYQLQADIALNTNERNAIVQNKYHHISGLLINFSPSKIIQFGHVSCTYLMQAELSAMSNEMGIFNLSNLHAEANLHYQNKNVRFKSNVKANHGLLNPYVVHFIGGSRGSLISSQYESTQMEAMNKFASTLIQQSGFVRGFNVGSRVGNQSLVMQNEFLMSPLSFFPSRVIESNFLKKLFFVGFLDFGTAFVGATPKDAANPFNTIFYKGNTYDLSVTAIRDGYLLGIGYGLNMDIWGYEFRLEKAYGITDNSVQNRVIHFCIGKNF